MDGTSIVEREVRELVRRRGLDPAADAAAVRRLVDEVITDYDERALASTLPPLPEQAHRRVYDAVAGYGPLHAAVRFAACIELPHQLPDVPGERLHQLHFAESPRRGDMWTTDILQIDYQRDKTMDHSMIATKLDGREVYFSYHSDDTKNRAWRSIYASAPGAWYHGFRT